MKNHHPHSLKKIVEYYETMEEIHRLLLGQQVESIKVHWELLTTNREETMKEIMSFLNIKSEKIVSGSEFLKEEKMRGYGPNGGYDPRRKIGVKQILDEISLEENPSAYSKMYGDFLAKTLPFYI